MTTPAYLRELSSYLAEASFADFPEAVVARATQVLTDSIVVIGTGAAEPEMIALRRELAETSGGGNATVIGADLRTDPKTAAFLNGTAGTFLELDEGNQFARGHPGIHVVPAGLAVAEQRGLSGRDLLTAIILGYEVGARIGIACKLRMSMHPHGTWGTVGSAVTVAKLMGCGAEAFAEIINISSSLGLATSRQTMLQGGTVRNSYSGISGHMGILAHELLRAGFSGEHDGLATVYGAVVSESFDPTEMTDALGSRYEIARNYFKRHACCRYNHGALDALETVLASAPGNRIVAEDVEAIDVVTYSLAAQLQDRQPRNTLAGKFSVPFAIATTIVNGGTGVESFTIDKVGNQKIRALAEKVSVVEDAELTAMMPALRPARVRVHMSDGSTLEAETHTNRGDTEDPYSESELAEKFDQLARRVWDGRAETVVEATAGIAETANVGTLTALLGAGAPEDAVAADARSTA
jgi:2-methylcitrate dehydratase PrpD